MAKHRRRRRRGFGDYVSVPGLSGLKIPNLKALNPLGKSVNSTDLFVGTGLGLAGGAAVKFGLNKIHVSLKKPDGSGGLPDFVMSYAGPLSTFLAGVLLYVLQRKTKAARAQAHLVGASLAAFAPIFWKALGDFGPKMADGTPFFSDYVMTKYGLLSADQPYGLLTADGTPTYSGNEDWDPLSAP